MSDQWIFGDETRTPQTAADGTTFERVEIPIVVNGSNVGYVALAFYKFGAGRTDVGVEWEDGISRSKLNDVLD